MSNQKSPEETMNLVLSGDTLKNALDFVGFLRENKLQMEYNPDECEEGKWTGAIGGIVGDSIGYMYVRPGTGFPEPWNIWLNEYAFDTDGSAGDEELKEFIWENVNGCGKCNPNWENCGGGERTIMGKTFERLCHSPMFFYMPDAQKLEKLKRLILKIKQKREGV
jgi:hypothetical protein